MTTLPVLYRKGDCSRCAGRVDEWSCAAEPRSDRAAAYHLCALAEQDPARWGPGVQRLTRELASLVASREPERPSVPPLRDGARVIDPDTFLTCADLARDAAALAAHVPLDVDLVVAIPRSGLTPASLLAALRHVPLGQVIGKDVALCGGGFRMQDHPGMGRRPRRILLVDDTAARGVAMRDALPALARTWPGVPVTRCVIYCHSLAREHVDLYAASLDGLHYLEWNWNNAGHAQTCAYDFDGILCRDFTPQECASEDAYRQAMRTITPLYLPRRRPVPLIVTARPESCRELTEDWLARHGVVCERLVMWAGEPHPIADMAQKVGRWKGEHYRASEMELFAESDPAQAQVIADVAGKPVLCPAAGRLLRPAARSVAHDAPPLPPLGRQVLNAAKAVVRHVAHGGGTTDPITAAIRLRVCRGECPAGLYRDQDDRCAHPDCGCHLDRRPEGTPGKVHFPHESCPVGAWGAASGTGSCGSCDA
jgi:hypoxanthine phosphoribosyltransferase